MNPYQLQITAMTHVVYAAMLRLAPTDDDRDRGAVSIEQVLWYAAAAVAVAVIAGIIWSQIRTTASDVNPDVPAAP
jgi:hypothetical protein